MENAELKQINNNIEILKKMVFEIKTKMIDSDFFLTPEENTELDESIKRFNEGKTKNFDDFKKELK
jgi:hypothetical protein